MLFPTGPRADFSSDESAEIPNSEIVRGKKRYPSLMEEEERSKNLVDYPPQNAGATFIKEKKKRVRQEISGAWLIRGRAFRGGHPRLDATFLPRILSRLWSALAGGSS